MFSVYKDVCAAACVLLQGTQMFPAVFSGVCAVKDRKGNLTQDV